LIVWAVALDPAGRNPKARPLVLLVGEDEVRADAPLLAVGITGTLPTPLPDGYVLLPWDRAGHRQTGLKKKSAAVCNWIVRVAPSGSLQVIGRAPNAQFAEICQKVQAIRAQRSQQP
jgi:mRNA-degrading endonuclease toxin of MazEF toxin-antitoxin module